MLSGFELYPRWVPLNAVNREYDQGERCLSPNVLCPVNLPARTIFENHKTMTKRPRFPL